MDTSSYCGTQFGTGMTLPQLSFCHRDDMDSRSPNYDTRGEILNKSVAKCTRASKRWLGSVRVTAAMMQ